MCLFRYERATSTHCLRDLSFPVSVPAAALSACSCGLKSKNSRKTGRKGRRKGERVIRVCRITFGVVQLFFAPAVVISQVHCWCLQSVLLFCLCQSVLSFVSEPRDLSLFIPEKWIFVSLVSSVILCFQFDWFPVLPLIFIFLIVWIYLGFFFWVSKWELVFGFLF